jgi:glycosyltransferase involved in cell wall biosynthesis
MKIIHFGVGENYGGIENYVFDLFKEAYKSNIIFDFLVTNKNIAYNDFYIEKGSKISYVTPRSKNFLSNIFEVENFFKKNHYDILHVHLNNFSYIQPILSAIKNKCKVIIHSRSSNVKQGGLTNFLHHFNKIRLNFYNVVRIAVSYNSGKWLFDNKDFRVINNGVDFDKFSFNLEFRNEIKNEFKVNSKLILGNVGTLTYPKNQKFIIDIFEALLKLNDNWVLFFVGDGILRHEIIDYIKSRNLIDKCILTGIRRDVEKFYSAFDFLVFPSFFEGYPNVVVESQVSGLPSLISNLITNEVLFTEISHKYDIKKSASEWADKINTLQSLNSPIRENYSNFTKNLILSRNNRLNEIIFMYTNLFR